MTETPWSFKPLEGATNIRCSPIIEDKLYLEISLADIGLSPGGTVIMVATSNGNRDIEGFTLGLNLFRPRSGF